jgi:hypothetical protein
LKAPLLGGEEVDDQPCRHRVGEDGGDGDAVHAPVQDQHEEQVHEHVQDAGEEQGKERPPAVPLAAQHCGAEVVNHLEGHTHQVQAKVKLRQVHHICRRCHEGQNPTRKELSHRDDGNTCQEREGDHRVHSPVDCLFLPPGSQGRDDHVGTNGDADKGVDQEVDDGAVGTDCRLRLTGDKVAHHRGVRGVEQLLQDAGHGQRQCKQQESGPDRAVQHIDIMR